MAWANFRVALRAAYARARLKPSSNASSSSFSITMRHKRTSGSVAKGISTGSIGATRGKPNASRN